MRRSSILTRFFRIAPAQPDSEFYVGRGNQRLNDGVVELALNDLSAAIDLAPQHGIALALAAIVAVRAGNRALQQKIIERYCSASKQFWLDLAEVGKWYSTPPERSTNADLQLEQNRAAFKTFIETLGHRLKSDKERSLWLAEGLEHYVSRGHKRLNDGLIDLASEDLFIAIDLLPQHGIALALAAIAAVRASNAAAQQKVIERYCSASKQLLFDLAEVGKWYSRPPERGPEADQEMERNRVAFNTFISTLAPFLENDNERLFWLGEGLHTALLASVCSEVLTRYARKYPGHKDAEAMLVNALVLRCDFASSERFWNDQLARLDHQLNAGEPLGIDPYNLLLAGVDFGLFSRVCRRHSMDLMPANGSTIKLRNEPRSDGRIKLGFVVPYSWFASVTVILHALLPEFDRTRFEIYGYHLNTLREPDAFENQYRQRVDHFVALDGLAPDAAARRIAADGIDIAIDLSGHTRATCIPIMAYRVAPIQAHFLGWGTLIEAPYIDYLITDPHYHPQHLRDMTTETYALLPEGAWIYLPVEGVDGGHDQIASSSPFRFCSFSYPDKIDRDTFEAWMEILRGTDDSVLVLCHWNLGDAMRNMRAGAERAGIDPARLVFLPVVSHADHLRRLRSMDLALDTLRIGGGATTMDALWAGLPIVSACTHKNYLHASRGAFGSLAMSEELLTDVSSYVNRAIELRNNPSGLAALREKTIARRQGSLMFDPPRYAAELQRLIQAMWARHLRGEKPATFILEPAA